MFIVLGAKVTEYLKHATPSVHKSGMPGPRANKLCVGAQYLWMLHVNLLDTRVLRRLPDL